jgi:CheY-like chemotaxis protein
MDGTSRNAGSAGSRTEEGAQERALRVLVIEDNRDAADSLCLLLRSWGFDCRAAYDGPAGLQAAGEYRPDCVVADIGLPALDGYARARRLRQVPQLGTVKLVALTGYADGEHRRRAAEAGFDHHISKGVSPLEVRRVLEMMEMVDEVLKPASQTEGLARPNVALGGQNTQRCLP